MTWLNRLASIGKLLLALIAVMVMVFTLGHLGMQYGIELGEIPRFLERTWLLWLVVRWAMYAVGGWFLWKLGKIPTFSGNENAKHYKRLVRTAIIAALCIETVVLTRLFGG